MKQLKLFIMLCFSVMLTWQSTATANEPPGIQENIAAAIRTGNSKELSKYFAPTVEIVLPGSDGAFSKAQAEMIMKDFFAKSAPVAFSMNQKGNSTGGAQFIIGTYKNKSETLNVYILLKQTGGQLLIQQMHFESD